MANVKLVIVGNGSTGKSCLLISYTTNAFPGEYVPTVFDNYATNTMVDGRPVNLALWDTAGQEDYDRLRPLSYPQTDVFMIGFAMNSRDSFEAVRQKWVLEIQHHAPGVPFMLVGCKSDLLQGTADDARNSRRQPVSVFEAEAEARALGAAGFACTSALTQDGVQAAFEAAVRSAVRRRERGSKAKSRAGAAPALPPRPTAPVMPEAGRAPWIHPDGATLARDALALLRRDGGTRPAWGAPPDCTIELGGGKALGCHRAVLAAACPGFERCFRALEDGVGLDDSPWAATTTSVGALRPCAAVDQKPAGPATAKEPPVPQVPPPSAPAPAPSAGAPDESAPDDLRCPLSLELFDDPVIAEDGHTYEKKAIEGWIRQNRTSPLTREPISAAGLLPNRNLQRLVRAWREAEGQPAAPPPPAAGAGDVVDGAPVRPAAAPGASPAPPSAPPYPAPGAADGKPAQVPVRLVLDATVATAAATRVVIEWLYTGSLPAGFAGNPSAAPAGPGRAFAGSSADRALLREVAAAANAFSCDELATAIANIESGDQWLNGSFSTFLCDRAGKRSAELLLGEGWLADVSVRFSCGTEVAAHAAVLAARCPALRPVLSGGGGGVVVNFGGSGLPRVAEAAGRAVLGFLYSDHFATDGRGHDELVDIIRAASALNLPRLVTLCELRASKQVEAAVAVSIAKSEINVVALLVTASACGAAQLEKFLLHFLASNYGPMSKQLQLAVMSEAHRKHVVANQWPSPQYLEQTAQHKKAVKAWEARVAALRGAEQAGRGCCVQ